MRPVADAINDVALRRRSSNYQPHSSSKQVHFASRVEGKHIESWRLLSDEEIASRWRTAKEARDNELEMVMTVRLMASNGGILPARYRNDDNVTSRGVEHMATKEIIRSRAHYKEMHVNAILDECCKQAMLKKHDPIAIAEISKRHSSEAVTAARRRAKADAFSADLHYLEKQLGDESSDSSSSSSSSSSSTYAAQIEKIFRQRLRLEMDAKSAQASGQPTNEKKLPRHGNVVFGMASRASVQRKKRARFPSCA